MGLYKFYLIFYRIINKSHEKKKNKKNNAAPHWGVFSWSCSPPVGSRSHLGCTQMAGSYWGCWNTWPSDLDCSDPLQTAATGSAVWQQVWYSGLTKPTVHFTMLWNTYYTQQILTGSLCRGPFEQVSLSVLLTVQIFPSCPLHMHSFIVT